MPGDVQGGNRVPLARSGGPLSGQRWTIVSEGTMLDCDAVWTLALERIGRHVGPDSLSAWISPLRLLSIDAGTARFAVPTSFFGNWVDRHYADTILACLRESGAEVRSLAFDIQPGAVQPRPNGSRPVAPQPEPELPGSPLDPRLTFDRFVVGKPNEMANAAARRVAESDDVSFNPLFLYGGVGLGKTHLMQAIAWAIRERAPEKKVIYLSAEQFMYRFVNALRYRDMLGFKQIFRSVDVLMVDDVQFIGGKDSTQDEFFHTFNALVEQRKQIVISGDRSPGDMENLDERIRSRLQWGLVVDIHPTDYELRLGVLESKAEAHLAAHPDTQLASGVLEFLAHRISSNVRVLEGALTRLFAFAELVGRRIDLDMVQQCLSDVLRASDRKVTVEEIIRKVAEHYNVRVSDLLSPRRARVVARPRQIAMFLAKQLTSKSLPDIGRRFGGRDHTTVLHALKRVEELRQTDSAIAEDLELLRRMLEG